MPRCPNFDIHMHAKNMIRHQRASRCTWVTDMRLRRRDLDIAERAGEMKFSVYYKEDDPLV